LRLHWWLAWHGLYPLARLLVGLRVRGRERLVRGPQILAANHVSNIDPVIVGLAAKREVHFLAKEELFLASRFFAWLIRAWNAWPLRRGVGDAGAIKRCSSLLQAGHTVVLFPEGGRSKTAELLEFRAGIGLLSQMNRVPVVPVHVGGVATSTVSWLVDKDFVKRGLRARPKKSTPIRVTFGEPVRPDGFREDREGQVELAREVENRVRLMAGAGA
jgi:1-acyl-sn-glycerol-3-phosphate acyltransferase